MLVKMRCMEPDEFSPRAKKKFIAICAALALVISAGIIGTVNMQRYEVERAKEEVRRQQLEVRSRQAVLAQHLAVLPMFKDTEEFREMSMTKIQPGGSGVVRCYFEFNGDGGRNLTLGIDCANTFIVPSAGGAAGNDPNGITNSEGFKATWAVVREGETSHDAYVDVLLEIPETWATGNKHTLEISSTDDKLMGSTDYSASVDIYGAEFKIIPPGTTLSVTAPPQASE